MITDIRIQTDIGVTDDYTEEEEGPYEAEITLEIGDRRQVFEGVILWKKEFPSYYTAHRELEEQSQRALEKVQYIFGIKPYENEFNQL